jgi:AAA+ superfamily predicted ATPase
MSNHASNIQRDSIQRHLAAELAVIRKRLERCVAAAGSGDIATHDAELHAASGAVEQLRRGLAEPTPLDVLCGVFGLSSFERDLVLLCAGVELDHGIASLCTELQGDRAPTFALALAVLPQAAWGPLSSDAPLRCWHIIEPGAGSTLATRRLRIDEYVLHFILGLSAMDERLFGLFEPVEEPPFTTPSQRAAAERISGLWVRDPSEPIISLCGPSPAALRAVAAHTASCCGLRLYAVDARDLPDTSPEQLTAARLWQRHAALTASALIIEVTTETAGGKAAAFAERLRAALFVAALAPLRLRGRASARVDIGKPLLGEQRALWQDALGVQAGPLAERIEAVVAQFHFGTDDILAVAAKVRLQPDSRGAAHYGALLWEACRTQARPQLDHLAQHIDPRATWDDLILDGRSKQLLREISVHVRQKTRVYETWGFAERSSRGLGISALFAGPSGTGKTTAAEVLARELELDLYRIDLSALVSKYIGETEKNLRQVFDAAEDGGAILLFDEADALFGKRSEVKDSHDRYANMEVSYLLQRMEAYRGLAILTTNLRDSLDSAFMRRIRFVVEFPFPSPEQRVAIWQRMFPAGAPTQDLDLAKLARLNLAGGSIRNVALGAAFLAAEEGTPIQMRHLQEAARNELAKLERPVPERELKDWT